jgi:hypothetical protein
MLFFAIFSEGSNSFSYLDLLSNLSLTPELTFFLSDLSLLDGELSLEDVLSL